jgi:hypothetical protein
MHILHPILTHLPAAGLALISCLQALGGTVNMTQGGKTTYQTTTLGGFTAAVAVNNVTTGINPDFTHTNNPDPNPYWLVDLGVNVPVESIRVFNRTECCGGRLRDITVEVLNLSSNVVYTSGLFNPTNSLGGGLNNYTLGPPQTNTFNVGGAFGRFVKISRTPEGTDSHDPNVLSLSEVQVFADNLALGRPAVQSSDHGGGAFPAPLATNGNLGDFTHTANSDGNPYLRIDLQESRPITSLLIHNRDNCCPSRLRDLYVDILDEGTNVTYTTPELNDANVLNGPPFIGVDFVALTGGSVTGRYIRLRRVDTVTGADETSVISVGEIEVFGPPRIQITPVAYAANQAVITWNAIPGAAYSIEWSTNYTTWTPHATGVVASSSSMTLAIPDDFNQPFVIFRVVRTGP